MLSEKSSHRMRSLCWLALPLFAAVTTGGVVDRAAVANASAISAVVPDLIDSGRQEESVTASWPGYRGHDRDGVYRGAIRLSWEGLTPMWKKPVGGDRERRTAARSRSSNALETRSWPPTTS